MLMAPGQLPRAGPQAAGSSAPLASVLVGGTPWPPEGGPGKEAQVAESGGCSGAGSRGDGAV